MRYAFSHNLKNLHDRSRTAYHLAMASAVAKEDGDNRMHPIIDLMTEAEREEARRAKDAARG